ncbi:unnamed protein product [Angiostrongylus costaricensis]|uniref:DIX domain-containing protein n=1 Tax=Angiostrongylus costaricensis TaxID=334426 RepID=A0A0R3PI72_ANGCS|nr:unnamed protein product [Angiostrongylus costaricensis]
MGCLFQMNMNCEDFCDFSTERRRFGSSSKKPQLTAETLMKTRFDREHVLGERLRSIREEHLRGNPTTFAIPRVEHHSKTDMKFDHNTEDGRKTFAGVLCKKLNRLKARRERNDETERQLRDIESRKCTTRELISTSEAAHVATCDDDDDVECYLERMREDSLKTSANRSPCHNAVSPRPFSPEHDRKKIDCGTGDGSLEMRSMLNYPRSANQFAPPPLPCTFNTSGVYCKEMRSGNQTAPIYDSSGVESMAPSAFSDTSGGSRKTPLIAPMLDTPRRTRRSVPSGQLMTISYKGVCVRLKSNLLLIGQHFSGTDGVPVVAHVPASVRGITLKEFRRHFSISSHANVQFFFKSTCEDGSAPYQLLLVNEDSAYLPVFEGKITAELKRISPE